MIDYYQTLGLTKEPFSTSPDPTFFYQSTTHKQVLNNLLIELQLRRGMSVVLGDIGTGKTMLSRKLIHEFSTQEGFFFHTILDPVYEDERDFLDTLVRVFGGIESTTSGTDPRLTNSKLKEAIYHFLQKAVQEKKYLVLIIDEAQKLSETSLELLRILLNYETNENKLLQVVLLGQGELEAKLRAIPNLIDRVSFIAYLKPLDQSQTEEMIKFRLHQAGYKDKTEIFTKEALKEIYQQSLGCPRQITLLCHHGLRHIIRTDKKFVDIIVVGIVVRSLRGKDLPRLLAGSEQGAVVVSAPAPGQKVPVPSAPLSILAKIRSARPINRLIFILCFILFAGAIGLLVFNYYRPNKITPTPPQETSQLAQIETLYQTITDQYRKLTEEQTGRTHLITDLAQLRDNQQLPAKELLQKLNDLEASREKDRERILGLMEQIIKVQSLSQLPADDKFAKRLTELKENVSALSKRLASSPATGAGIKNPVVLGADAPDGIYIIRLTDAVITPTDWTDNDLGTKAAPPDCFVVVLQNDTETFKSLVKLDTHNPVWNEEFILDWKKGSKLELTIYDLDAEEKEKILSWDNTNDQEFLFKDTNLRSPQGSCLNYEIFQVLIKTKKE